MINLLRFSIERGDKTVSASEVLGWLEWSNKIRVLTIVINSKLQIDLYLRLVVSELIAITLDL